MNISSKEIKKNDFKKIFRGYDANEVDAFLETVSSHYERLVVDNRSMSEKIKDLSADVEIYKENEKTLQKAIVKSQEMGEEIITNAKSRAENIVKEAELNARKLKQDLEEDILNKRSELEEIKQRNERLIEDVRGFITDKLSELEDFLKDRKIITLELARREDYRTEDIDEMEHEVQKEELKLKKISQGAGSSFDDSFEIK